MDIPKKICVSEPLDAHHNLHFYGKFAALKILINNLRKSQLILYMERLLLFRVCMMLQYGLI